MQGEAEHGRDSIHLPCAGCRSWHPAFTAKNVPNRAGGISFNVPQEWIGGVLVIIDCARFRMKRAVRHSGVIPENSHSFVRQLQRSFGVRDPRPPIGAHAILACGVGGAEHRCFAFLCSSCSDARGVRCRVLRAVIVEHWQKHVQIGTRHVEEYAESAATFLRLKNEAQIRCDAALVKAEAALALGRGRKLSCKTVANSSSQPRCDVDQVGSDAGTSTSLS